MNEDNIIDCIKEVFRRVSLDEDIDILAEGEEPKHGYYILVTDIPEITEAIKNKTRDQAFKLIAEKIKRVG